MVVATIATKTTISAVNPTLTGPEPQPSPPSAGVLPSQSAIDAPNGRVKTYGSSTERRLVGA